MDKQNKFLKNLEVWITANLSTEKHIHKTIEDTYQLLRNIRIVFKCLDEDILRN